VPTPRSQKQRRILTAAREICSEKGFEATRMEEIASRAGVSKGTLYNFFPSKEDLFVDTVLSSYQGFGELPWAVVDTGADPANRLAALVEALASGFDEFSRRIPLAHQAWSVVLRAPATRQRLFGTLRDVYAAHGEGLAEILRAGVRSGQFRSDLDIEVVTATWIATVDGLLYRSGFDDPEQTALCSPEGVRACLGWLMDSIAGVSEAHATDTHAATPPPLAAPAEERPL
jgi:AcrR family transcriptional regulator